MTPNEVHTTRISTLRDRIHKDSSRGRGFSGYGLRSSKTSITLTAIHDLLFDSFEVRRVLVVAPLRVGLNSWPTELEKWSHLKDISYSVAIGSEAERKAALLRQADIYIINRENVQ